MPINLAERCCKAKLPSPLSTLAALPPCTLQTTGVCGCAFVTRDGRGTLADDLMLTWCDARHLRLAPTVQ